MLSESESSKPSLTIPPSSPSSLGEARDSAGTKAIVSVGEDKATTRRDAKIKKKKKKKSRRGGQAEKR